LSVKVTFAGRVPVWLRVGVGDPSVVILNVPGDATVNVALGALVIAGPCMPTPLRFTT
jgi:hypothetical protein